jgi:hypothetical protein
MSGYIARAIICTFKSWCLATLKEHLNLYHVFENGVEYYKRVRWTKKGTLVYTAGTTDFASGLAGAPSLIFHVASDTDEITPAAENVAVPAPYALMVTIPADDILMRSVGAISEFADLVAK